MEEDIRIKLEELMNKWMLIAQRREKIPIIHLQTNEKIKQAQRCVYAQCSNSIRDILDKKDEQ